MAIKKAAFVTCHKCGEELLLATLTVLEAGTNEREEDTVGFDCPECKKRVTGAKIWVR
jgi:predicted RNA-binding Zn-ribbon protein involved in translation (DUF1610 family)